jgi:hypothetical protein
METTKTIKLTLEAHEQLRKLAFYEGKNLQDAVCEADKFTKKVPPGKVTRETELTPA